MYGGPEGNSCFPIDSGTHQGHISNVVAESAICTAEVLAVCISNFKKHAREQSRKKATSRLTVAVYKESTVA